MIIIFLVAILFHFGAIGFSFYAGFTKNMSEEVIVYSSLDLFLSFLVTYIAFKQFPVLKENASSIVSELYLKVFEKQKLILLFLLLIGAYSAYLSLKLIMSGVLRHDLLGEHERGGLFYMFFSGFFKIFFPVVLFFGASLRLKVIAFLGLLISILITASRSELRYVIHFFLIMLMFSHGSQLLSKSLKFACLALGMIGIAIAATSLVQNRPISDGVGALYDIVRTVFQYRSYGYYLAEISLNTANDIEKAIFPFGGYISEFFFRYAATPSVQIDSDYVGYLHNLGVSTSTGRPLLANVVYPWWSWFYGSFGPLGILLKAVFIYCLLVVCLSARLLFTTVLLLSFVLLGTAVSHPFMTLTHTMSFIVVIGVDLYVKGYRLFKFQLGAKNDR